VDGAGWVVLHNRYYENRPIDAEDSRPRIKSGVTKPRSTKVYHIVLAIILILFGISDFVEMATGAWWLLVWKMLCVVLGIIFLILIYNERSSR
jgi:hypothetical protein